MTDLSKELGEIKRLHLNRQAAIDRDEDFYWSRELAPGTDEYHFVKRPNSRAAHYHRKKLLHIIETEIPGMLREIGARHFDDGHKQIDPLDREQFLSAGNALRGAATLIESLTKNETSARSTISDGVK